MCSLLLSRRSGLFYCQQWPLQRPSDRLTLVLPPIFSSLRRNFENKYRKRIMRFLLHGSILAQLTDIFIAPLYPITFIIPSVHETKVLGHQVGQIFWEQMQHREWAS